MVTHDQEEAMTMAGRIAVMSKGRVLQVGSPEEVYEHPVNRFVADFIGNVNLFEGRLSIDEPDHCAAATGIGEVHVGHGISGTLNMPVAIAVRPEKIGIGQQAPALGAQCVSGTGEGDRLLRLLQHLHRAGAGRLAREDHRSQHGTPCREPHHVGRRSLRVWRREDAAVVLRD